MDYGDDYWRSYRDYHRDPFPHSLLSTRQIMIMMVMISIPGLQWSEGGLLQGCHKGLRPALGYTVQGPFYGGQVSETCSHMMCRLNCHCHDFFFAVGDSQCSRPSLEHYLSCQNALGEPKVIHWDSIRVFLPLPTLPVRLRTWEPKVLHPKTFKPKPF